MDRQLFPPGFRLRLSQVALGEVATLLYHRVPLVAVQLVALVFAAGLAEGHPVIQGAEYFAGKAAVSRAMRAAVFFLCL